MAPTFRHIRDSSHHIASGTRGCGRLNNDHETWGKVQEMGLQGAVDDVEDVECII